MTQSVKRAVWVGHAGAVPLSCSQMANFKKPFQSLQIFGGKTLFVVNFELNFAANVSKKT